MLRKKNSPTSICLFLRQDKVGQHGYIYVASVEQCRLVVSFGFNYSFYSICYAIICVFFYTFIGELR